MPMPTLPPLPGLVTPPEGRFSDQFVGGGSSLPQPVAMPKANVSAYTLAVGETDSNPNEGAFGTKPFPGSIATSDMTLGPGSVIKVGGKLYIVADRLGPDRRKLAQTEGRPGVDILMDTRDNALKFGRQEQDYQVVERNNLGRNFDPTKEYPGSPTYNSLIRKKNPVASVPRELMADLPGLTTERHKPSTVFDHIGSVFDFISKRF